MRTRPLGASGIEASVVGFGAWAVGGWMWGGTEEADSVRAIQAAIDAGITLIDTAPMYGFGRSEQIVGRAIRGRRDAVVLATKCGLIWHAQRGQFNFETDEKHPVKGGGTRVYRCLAPDVIRYEIEQSLGRLGVDCIDLYQTHWQEPTTPVAETMGELMRLKQEGKIRAIGCSNATPAHMNEYRAVGPLDADQEKYSMIDRMQEAQNLPYVARHGMAFLAYSPLAQGLLTGTVGPGRTFAEGDQRGRNKRYSVENRAKVAALLQRCAPVAAAHGITLGQLAIAWAVSQTGCTHALVGARTPAQAAENARAGGVALTAGELATIRAAIDTAGAGIQ